MIEARIGRWGEGIQACFQQGQPLGQTAQTLFETRTLQVHGQHLDQNEGKGDQDGDDWRITDPQVTGNQIRESRPTAEEDDGALT